MANEEQLAILRQGVEVWNKWRKENPTAEIDLDGANLSNADLRKAKLRKTKLRKARIVLADLREIDLAGANLSGAALEEADLTGANLSDAILEEADLTGANLSDAILEGADLTGANLWDANLTQANLTRSNATRTDLTRPNLHGANIRDASLESTNLTESYLENAMFTHAILNNTDFSFAETLNTAFLNTDLSRALRLDSIIHRAPSFIDESALVQSKGKIPERFLRGCGLSDWNIESAKLYKPDLSNEEIVKIQYRIYKLRATQAIQISPLFLSYSRADKSFVDKLETALTKKGIRFWRDIHDATAGRLETQIDRAIRQNPTVLLILSKNSIKSDWVEHEVRTARQLEKELGRDALCPIALDDGWKSSPWPKRVMEQVMEYNILDFSDWEDQSAFEGKFAKLLSGLDLFYKKAEE